MGGTRGCCELDQSLKRFWEIESYGTEVSGRIVCTKEERLALETVSRSVRYSDGRYSVAVPWKEQRPCLPNNLKVAESRLHSTERNLKKKDSLRRSIRRLLIPMWRKGIFAKFLKVKHHPLKFGTCSTSRLLK